MDFCAGLKRAPLWILALSGLMTSGCGDEDAGPIIVTTSLQEAEQGQLYSVELRARGAGALAWNVAPESALPPGLMLDNAGDKSALLSGTPTAPGIFRFEITLKDSRGQEARRDFALSIRSSLSLDGLSLPDAIEGRDYEAPLSPSGGADRGLEWRLVSGELPPGLALEDTAERVAAIRGRPGPGTFRFTVEVVDGAGGRAQNQLELRVRSSLAVVADEPPTGRTGRAYSWTLSVEGGLGEGVDWRVRDTPLPPGLSFGPAKGRTVEIAGVPVSQGSYPITLVVEDANRGHTEASFTLDIFLSLNIATQSLPTADRGGAYSARLEAVGGGSVDYNWTMIAGDLPPGLQLTDDGAAAIISGVATRLGGYTFTASVATPVDEAVTRVFELVVASAPPRITTESLPAAEWGEAYVATIEGASRVGGPVEWSIDGLPPGLVLEDSSTTTVTLSGVPQVAADFEVDVRMSDAGGNDVAHLAVRVMETRLAIEKEVLPLGRVGDAYERPLRARNAVGDPTWSLTDGELPPGMGLTPNGVLVGTPTGEGTFRFELGVEDAGAGTARGRFVLHVRPERRWIIVGYATDGPGCGADNVMVLDVSSGVADRRHDLALDLGGPCSAGSVGDFSVSPDSRWASFTFGPSYYSRSLYLVDLREEVPSMGIVDWYVQGYYATLRWSPDGQSAFYSGRGGPTRDHWLLDFVAGAPGEPIELGRGTDGRPEWSPDGRRVAFLSEDQHTLIVADRNTGSWRPRTFDLGDPVATQLLSWTPDSRRVVYARWEGMYAIDLEVARPVPFRLTKPGVHPDGSFSDEPLSPDGSRLLFRLSPEPLVMDLSTGASVTTAIPRPAPNWSMRGGWSPDSRHLMWWERGRGDFGEIGAVYYLVHVDDNFTRTRIETDGLSAIYRVYWTPTTHSTLVDSSTQGVYLSAMGPPSTLELLNFNYPHVTSGGFNFAAPHILLPSTHEYMDLSLPAAERVPVSFDPDGRYVITWPDLIGRRAYFYNGDSSPYGLYLIDFGSPDPPTPAILVDLGDSAWVSDLRFPDNPFL